MKPHRLRITTPLAAETALKELRDELTLTFSFETGLWAGQPDPSVEQTKHALSSLQGFLARVNQIVRDETNHWKVEFQTALQQTGELAKVQISLTLPPSWTRG